MELDGTVLKAPEKHTAEKLNSNVSFLKSRRNRRLYIEYCAIVIVQFWFKNLPLHLCTLYSECVLFAKNRSEHAGLEMNLTDSNFFFQINIDITIILSL